jgi:hypothetical protein
MKESLSTALIAAAVAVAAYRLYQKYIRKDKGEPGKFQKKGPSAMSSSKEDDYEPYSKK